MLRTPLPRLACLFALGLAAACSDDSGSEADGDAGMGDEQGVGDDNGTDDETGGELDRECEGEAPLVVIETSLGTMVVELDAARAPITVENFLTYVSEDFYDGTVFHRVIDGFVIQGGGFGPDYIAKPTRGSIVREIDPALRHVDGAIAMARSMDPDSAQSQWYITDGAQPGLDDEYAVFGVLIDGTATRDAISAVETGPGTLTLGDQMFEVTDVPVEDVVVEQAYCVSSWP